ncbi:O-methyltransferase [Scrofimicrobium sp. R131]|uniref:O-methyltransferase n=1 Tax=Scrofimicrobium appendicitidis TaxID=3079930 RepID=A0AAU7V9W2_9ACTO
MARDIAQVWDFCENYVSEPEPMVRAREVALELGADPVSPGTGALLRTLAATRDARAVIEIGTGAGVGSLWLLAGMNPDGVLTTIDPEGEFQRAARANFRQAGIASHRSRFINDRALDVLPRMAEDAYDLVVIDGPAEETPQYLDHAARMLRRQGILVVVNALWNGNVANPAKRDMNTVIMREMTRALLESEQFVCSLLPIGEGVEVAVRV